VEYRTIYRTQQIDDSRFSTERPGRKMHRPFCCCTDCHHRRGCSSRSSRVCPSTTIWWRRTIPVSATAIGPIQNVRYTFDHYAEIMNHFTEALGSHATRCTCRTTAGRWLSHGIGASGPNRGAHRPGRCRAQRRTRRELEPEARVLGRPRGQREHAADKSSFARDHADSTCRQRSERRPVRPGSLDDEFAFLKQPGQAEIQSDLFYDYRTNVAAYPSGRRGCERRSHDFS